MLFWILSMFLCCTIVLLLKTHILFSLPSLHIPCQLLRNESLSLCEFFILLFGKWIAVNSYSVQPSCSCYKLVDPCLGNACCICSHSKGVVCSICSIMYQPAWSPFHSMYVTVSTLGVDTVSGQVNSHQQKYYICRLNCHRSSVGVRFPSTLV